MRIKSFEILVSILFLSLLIAVFSPLPIAIHYSLFVALSAIALITVDDLLDAFFAGLYELFSAVFLVLTKWPFPKSSANQKVRLNVSKASWLQHAK